MHIIHIASELAPIAKVGGLADVVYGLCRQLKVLGHTVEIILPKYQVIDKKYLLKEKVEIESFQSYENNHWLATKVTSIEVDSCKVFLIDSVEANYFSSGEVYSGNNDIARFLFFCRAAIEYLHQRKTVCDLVHLHDWHTAIIAKMYKDLFWKSDFSTKGFALTIHNLQYQGICSASSVEKIGLTARLENGLTEINLLQLGIIHCDGIVAVSPNYAKEILSKENAFGLEETLRKYQKKLTGIINGIDYGAWDPQTDKHLAINYTHTDPIEKILQAKKENKKALQKKLAIEEKDLPLFICISRIVSQKGPEMMKEGLLHATRLGAQSILLGSILEKRYEQEFLQLQKNSPHNLSLQLSYDEELARLLFAAADFLFVPSIFEPCGLTQLIAMRYGTIPIVRQTGGLADTVIDIDFGKPENKRNGFVFQKIEIEEMQSTIERAFAFYQNKKEWQKIVSNNISADYSWDQSAKQYEKIYNAIINPSVVQTKEGLSTMNGKKEVS